MGSRNSNRRVVGVILIIFLSFWLATAGSVATAAGQPLDDAANGTDSTETIQNTTDTVESTLDGANESLAYYETVTQLLLSDEGGSGRSHGDGRRKRDTRRNSDRDSSPV